MELLLLEGIYLVVFVGCLVLLSEMIDDDVIIMFCFKLDVLVLLY